MLMLDFAFMNIPTFVIVTKQYSGVGVVDD